MKKRYIILILAFVLIGCSSIIFEKDTTIFPHKKNTKEIKKTTAIITQEKSQRREFASIKENNNYTEDEARTLREIRRDLEDISSPECKKSVDFVWCQAPYKFCQVVEDYESDEIRPEQETFCVSRREYCVDYTFSAENEDKAKEIFNYIKEFKKTYQPNDAEKFKNFYTLLMKHFEDFREKHENTQCKENSELKECEVINTAFCSSKAEESKIVSGIYSCLAPEKYCIKEL